MSSSSFAAANTNKQQQQNSSSNKTIKYNLRSKSLSLSNPICSDASERYDVINHRTTNRGGGGERGATTRKKTKVVADEEDDDVIGGGGCSFDELSPPVARIGGEKSVKRKIDFLEEEEEEEDGDEVLLDVDAKKKRRRKASSAGASARKSTRRNAKEETKKKKTTTTTKKKKNEKKKKKDVTAGSGYATPIATYFTSDEGSRHAATGSFFASTAKTSSSRENEENGARKSPVSMQKWMREALKAPVKGGLKFDLEETPPNDANNNTIKASSFASPKRVDVANNFYNNDNKNKNASNNSNVVTPIADGGGMTTPRFRNLTPRDIFSSLRTTPI
jgi:hypothetical protein